MALRMFDNRKRGHLESLFDSRAITIGSRFNTCEYCQRKTLTNNIFSPVLLQRTQRMKSATFFSASCSQKRLIISFSGDFVAEGEKLFTEFSDEHGTIRLDFLRVSCTLSVTICFCPFSYEFSTLSVRLLLRTLEESGESVFFFRTKKIRG